ncbi:RNA-guided endonuclease TnpB family protein [Bacillus sp. J14TS2]|uniref:RNA-guided endonuclease InsQ/TnpB family protein n=1 Tax=Bacillus sp. J14TS2 TaxID=2807188 RepID=UPI001BB300A8|nr:RNA-guided endonuclease TnpB family protein [Bacillus sp. J14TS2]
MLVNYQYEIYPNEEQRKKLDTWLHYCRHLYNSALIDKHRMYQEDKTNYSRYDMQKQLVVDKKKFPFLSEVPSQPLQEVFVRLEKAFNGFFDQRSKYPKIKKYKDYNSLTFTQFGYNKKGNRMALSFTEDGKLFNGKIGTVNIKMHRPIEGAIKQVVIKRKGGRWFAIFSVVGQVKPQTLRILEAVGIDVGLNKYAVLSDGTEIENPRYLRQAEKQLRKAQKKLSRMTRGSANYKQQAAKVEKLHMKVANQRKDFLHKKSYRIAINHSVVCVEDLNIRQMVRNRKLSKSISDAGWGMFRNMLGYKCRRNGGLLVKVIPEYTTQDCSSCRNRVKKSLSVRTHICMRCGAVLGRDHNAARNILAKGLEQLQIA